MLMQEDATQRIVLEGVQNLQTAAALKATLQREIASGKPIMIDLDGAESVDISAAQLLIAASRSAAATGTAFAVRCSAESATARQLKGFGFTGAGSEGWLCHKGDAL